MNDTAAIGAALAAMQPHDDTRYEGTLMRSALPGAPTIQPGPTIVERLRRLLQATPRSDLVVVQTADHDLVFEVRRDGADITVTRLRGRPERHERRRRRRGVGHAASR